MKSIYSKLVFANSKGVKASPPVGQMPLFIGIDGGGTSSKVALVNGDGLVLCERSYAASNVHSVGKDASRDAILACIDGVLCSNDASDTVLGIAAGISGVHTATHAATYTSWIRSHAAVDVACDVDVFNDTLAALVSGTNGERRGVALIAGTGSNCVAASGVRTVGVGGWGPALGAHGSGHALASDALAACCRALDASGPATRLVELLERALEWPRHAFAERVIEWAYDDATDWAKVAALAEVVLEAAEAGDGVAEGLVQRVADEQALAAETAIRKIGFSGIKRIPVILVGSLWKSDRIRHAVEKRLNQTFPERCDFIVPTRSAAVGAALFALRKHKKRLQSTAAGDLE